MVTEDERIRREVLRAAAEMDETFVSCSVADGHVILEGVVSSDERAAQLEAAARSVPGAGFVTNDLVVEGFAAMVENVVEGVDLTPDFAAAVGTEDPFEAVSEAEPYIPPTDPVVKPDRSPDGLEMLGGFATSADEGDILPDIAESPRGDDDLREAVLEMLHRDASTTDLTVEVEVEDGVVYLRGLVPSLEDADLVESVAARVPGVEDVQEELRVLGM